MRPVKCKVCGVEYTKERLGQKACSVSCAIKLVNTERALAAKKAKVIERRADKLKLKTRADWLREAQAAFNKYIRTRDQDQPCISCQRHHEGQYHAGHYLTTGARPELRFDEDNVHKQCAPCNNHLSGNLVLYRVNLIKKIGLERVEWLEGAHELLKLSIDRIKELITLYRTKTKGLHDTD